MHISLVHFSGIPIIVEWYGFHYFVFLVHVYIYIYLWSMRTSNFRGCWNSVPTEISRKKDPSIDNLTFKCSSFFEVSLWYKAKSVVKKASWVRPIIYQATSTYVHVCSQWFNDSKKTLLLRIDVIVASCSCDWPAIKIPVSPHSAALEAWHSKVFNANLFPSRNRLVW